MRPLRIGFASRDWSFANVGEGQDLTHELPSVTSENFQLGAVRPHIGGAGYYRMLLPARALQKAGHAVYLGTLVEHRDTGEMGVHTFDGLAHFGLDVLVLQRWMHFEVIAGIKRAVAQGQIVLNDVDDYFDGLDTANRAWHTSHPKTNPVENREHYRKIIAAGSGVICSTPFLMGKLGVKAKRAYLLRNRVDTDRYRSVNAGVGWTRPALGWVGARPWRSSGDVEALCGLVAPFLEAENLRFIHSGHLPNAVTFDGDEIPPLGETLGIPDERMTYRPLASMGDYPRLLEGFGIGLVPLADRPFNHAKSCIKGMEYAAAGVPFVATATPEYQWLQANHGIGSTARRPKDWLAAWKRLLDPDVRRAVAVQQRAAVTANLDASGYADDYEAILSHLLTDV